MTRRRVKQSTIDKYALIEDPTAIDDACYKVGEVVAIAQPYCDIVDKSKELRDVVLDEIGVPTREYEAGFYNKMFVRSDLMPHHIRITDVKVELLNEITPDDCIKEGIKDYSMPTEKRYGYSDLERENIVAFRTPRKAFAALIDRVSGKGVWDSNPWVFVYEFELVD